MPSCRHPVKSAFPTFGWILLLALLGGTIRSHEHYRQHPSSRAAVAGDPTAPADPCTPLRRPTTGGRPRGACRDHLPVAHWRPLAAAAHPPAWLRQSGHLLAAAAQLAARRRVAAAPPPAVGGVQPRGPAGLVAGQPGLHQRARQTGGCLTGPNPTDRGKPGSKYHLLTDRRGIPLAVDLSAANTHDSMLLEQVVDAVPSVKGPCGRPGRPRKCPAKLHLDRARTTRAVGGRCAGAASLHGLPGVASSPASGWAATGTW